MQLAERGTRLSNRLWLREIRKQSPSGRQTAILSTDYRASAGRLGSGHVCPMVSGKLLPIHAAKLQFG